VRARSGQFAVPWRRLLVLGRYDTVVQHMAIAMLVVHEQVERGM
jgi:hypothetical protein